MISDFGSSGFRIWVRVLAVVLAATLAGCAAKAKSLPPGTADADKFLFDRGTAAAKDKKWLDAREYFRNIVDKCRSPEPSPSSKMSSPPVPAKSGTAMKKKLNFETTLVPFPNTHGNRAITCPRFRDPEYARSRRQTASPRRIAPDVYCSLSRNPRPTFSRDSIVRNGVGYASHEVW